jgi:hypothetical protein
MDDSSNLGEEVNPINPALSRPVAFDIRHNFVISYALPTAARKPPSWPSNRWTQGWQFSGITHFSTGFPVTLVSYGDNSLLGTEPNGINNYSIDEPDYTGGHST